MDYIKLFYTGGNIHTEPTDAISAPKVFLNEAILLPEGYQKEIYTPEIAPIDAVSVQTVKLPETKQLPKVAQHLRKLQQQYPELTEEQLQAKYDELSAQLQSNAQLTQGRTQKKTPYEEQQSQLKQKQIEVQEWAQTEAEKQAKAMQGALALLQFISPSTWVEVMGNVDMSGAEEFLADIFLDPTTYLSSGIIPLLRVITEESAEKILREAAERGLKEVAEKKTNAKLIRSNLSRYQQSPEISRFSIPTPDYINDVVNIERQNLIEYYTSPEYQDRLAKAGLSPFAAGSRIRNLLKNIYNIPITVDPAIKAKGSSNVPMIDFSRSHIILNPTLWNDKDIPRNVIIEELSHASEMDGISEKDIADIVQELINTGYPDMSVKIADNYKFIRGNGSLHNDKAIVHNAQYPISVKPLWKIQEQYLSDPSEIRARAIRAKLALLKQKFLGITPSQYDLEFFNVYSGDKQKYFNNFISGAGIVSLPTLLYYQPNEETKQSNNQ